MAKKTAKKKTPAAAAANVDPKSGYEFFESPESTSIARAEYDKVNAILFIQFKHGRVYSHEKYPAKEWARFVASESKGRFYNDFIKDIYPSAAV